MCQALLFNKGVDLMGKDMKGKNLGGGISQRKDISVLQGLPAKAVRGLKSILKRLRMPKNGLRNQIRR